MGYQESLVYLTPHRLFDKMVRKCGEAKKSGYYHLLGAIPLSVVTLELSYDSFSKEYRLVMIGQLRHTVSLGTDIYGNIQRMDNVLETLPAKEQSCRERLEELHNQLETAKVEVEKPFANEDELKAKTARLDELNTLLNMDGKERDNAEKEKNKKKGAWKVVIMSAECYNMEK